jgi:hypothetical protein
VQQVLIHALEYALLDTIAVLDRLMNTEELLRAVLEILLKSAPRERIRPQVHQHALHVLVQDMCALQDRLMHMEELLQAALDLALVYAVLDTRVQVLQKQSAPLERILLLVR